MKTDLQKRNPETGLEHLADWTRLGPEQRRLRAAQALQDVADTRATGGHAAAELYGLVEAYVVSEGSRSSAVSENTLAAYRAGTETLLRWALSTGAGVAAELHRLTREQANSFRAWLGKHGGKRGAGLSPSSVNARLRDARVFWAALQWARLASATEEPFAKTRVKDTTPAHAKRKAFADSEVDALLAVTRDTRERVLVLLGADVALRVSETATLTWRAVDWTDREITVTGKGGRKDTVQVTPRCLEALLALHAEQGRPAGEKPIFGLTRQRVLAILKALEARAGVRSLGYHSLRHRAGTKMMQKTGSLQLTARHLRHSLVETSAIYAKMSDESYTQAVALLGEAIRGKTAAA